jgi:hypothetical protein
METVDNIAKLLKQQEELQLARNPSGNALNTGEQELAREGRNLGSFPNVMREAFEAAIRKPRRGKRYERA